MKTFQKMMVYFMPLQSSNCTHQTACFKVQFIRFILISMSRVTFIEISPFNKFWDKFPLTELLETPYVLSSVKVESYKSICLS